MKTTKIKNEGVKMHKKFYGFMVIALVGIFAFSGFAKADVNPGEGDVDEFTYINYRIFDVGDDPYNPQSSPTSIQFHEGDGIDVVTQATPARQCIQVTVAGNAVDGRVTLFLDNAGGATPLTIGPRIEDEATADYEVRAEELDYLTNTEVEPPYNHPYLLSAEEEALINLPVGEAHKPYNFEAGLVGNNSPPDEDIKIMIRTGERLLNSMPMDELNKDDFSTALIEYYKAVETMLHNSISLSFRDEIRNQYGKFIPRKYWGGDQKKKMDGLSFGLKRILNSEKVESASLGNWLHMMNDLEKSKFNESNNPIVLKFNNVMMNRFSKLEISEMSRLLETILPYRNGSSHTKVKKRNDVEHLRENEIIPMLNRFIDILYPKRIAQMIENHRIGRM